LTKPSIFGRRGTSSRRNVCLGCTPATGERAT
jgi:hypothetical protein